MAAITSPDYTLGGTELQARVREIFESIGLSVGEGPTDREDLILNAPDLKEPTIPIIVEVKSGNKTRPNHSHLRQLDDWVFDVSDEGNVRRKGILNQGRKRNWLSRGAEQASPLHSNPHKGLLIYNGPLDVPFEDRPQPILDEHTRKLAEKRSFCVMSMRSLLSWAGACQNSEIELAEFWKNVQMSMGELDEFKA